MEPELYQFPFSHYNEKARWAFDWKGVPHRRRSLLPGPHMPVMLWLTGQKQVPALRVGDEFVVGSARIIDHLEKMQPQPPLYPENPAERAEALDVARWFDDEVGPLIRRAFFFDFLPDGDYAARSFSPAAGLLARTAYRAAFPLTRIAMRLDMKVDAAGAEAGRERTAEALDRVARLGGRDGYLVGSRFSVADLTAAAILSPVVFPPESPIRLPEPRPQGLRTWIARWAEHPGVAWISHIYRQHRGQSAERA